MTAQPPRAQAPSGPVGITQDPMDPSHMPTLKHWGAPPDNAAWQSLRSDATVDCGWGRLIFGQTFASAESLADALRAEAPGERDVALYIRDPHVAIAVAPQNLFLDPSHTYRLALQAPSGSTQRGTLTGVSIRPAQTSDEATLNRIYQTRSMVPVRAGFLAQGTQDPALILLVAQDTATDQVLGTVTGVDHVEACNDPEQGCSLWSLAVDPQCPRPGVGEMLVSALIEHCRARGRSYMDLSVIHDNTDAIALYEKLGFERVPVYCVKHKNTINEQLFVGPDTSGELNIYARILVNEARRRGIGVEVLDAARGYYRLSLGGRSIVCRESLSELTTAIAMSRCDDKRVTRRALSEAGLRVPAQMVAGEDADVADFLSRHERVVVKPARGEQGIGVQVDLEGLPAVKAAIDEARKTCEDVIIEEMVPGDDLRVVVIDHQVVAAATRRPAEVVGNGRDDIRTLITKHSRRREAATAGESRIPLDSETERCVRAAGWGMNDVLPAGQRLRVRKAANLHTGGTIHDATGQLHPMLREVSERASRALDIPVVGLDLMVPDVAGETYAIIEANERPGLANHEPQPTAERFIDLLFPQTRAIGAT